MTERPAPNYSDAERELQRVEEKAVNDRTKAIVEAAERLAKGLDLSVMPNGAIYRTGHAKECECDHDDELDELLIPLGKALSLPSPQWTRTPPSSDGFWFARDHTPLPNWEKQTHLYHRAGCVWYGPLTSGDIPLEPDEVDELEFWPVRIEEPPA